MLSGLWQLMPSTNGVVTNTLVGSRPALTAATAQPDSAALGYLPDFAAASTVTALVIISQLVALALTIAGSAAGQSFFLALASKALVMLWMTLSSACVLTAARPVLGRQSTAVATCFSIGLILATIALLSEGTYRIGDYYAQSRLLDTTSFFPALRLEFLARNLALGALITAGLLRYFYVTHQWRRNVEREAAARISALQARIRPHFLFNSMNTIAALTRTDPAAAESAVEDLADLFRASLSNPSAAISLEEELEVTRVYQRMEQQRLGARLKVAWDIDGIPLQTLVPGLTIQPLLENAIYHGIEPRPEGGTVTVSGSHTDDMVTITVSNPLPTAAAQRSGGQRIALDNIRERLELAYGSRARMEIDNATDVFRVLIGFPVTGLKRV
jgi:two-component system sensor histidine kinase AlgZ